MPAPKSLSNAQKAVITGPGTPNSCSTFANKSRCCLSLAAPFWMRFCEISLPANAGDDAGVHGHAVEGARDGGARDATGGGLLAEVGEPAVETARVLAVGI